MNKTFVAVAATAVVCAAPASAQFSGNLHGTPNAGAACNLTHGDRSIYRPPVRRPPSSAHAQQPGQGNPDHPFGGYRRPGARYDEHGYYIDPNSPGRW